jgi:hypothetical protein
VHSTQDFRFDLPDGQLYTPKALPIEANSFRLGLTSPKIAAEIGVSPVKVRKHILKLHDAARFSDY